ncbi:C-GCAxxG-C-C family (seleno)protein [Methanoregula sp. UBA64]|jgi:C_GCAxxG_C_C family probable redox protein|uniref:C-GCAxxG-C-C family (seleno)protein n=1 Tax=Methanoregula sp. UBA64 TaxID=1915554 RepID=UPI0025EA6A3B|nr:C-GCAxxG-C-C family (seleno)protein [Methanoregula sp. UBA64]
MEPAVPSRKMPATTGEPDPRKIREIAEDYYRSGRFYCSEAIVKTINDEFRLGYPEDVIRCASGFPIGMGGAGCSCGAVTGGVMALGMAFGRKDPRDPAVERCLMLSRELHERFTARHGCACCRSLTRGLILKSPEHLKKCVSLTGEVAEETARIILRERQAGL